MAALSLWVRRTCARRWLGLLGLGLLIAVVGGVTLAVTAGARRTASAFERLQARTNAPEIQVDLNQPENPTEAQYAALPTPSTLADQIAPVPGVKGVAVATFMGASPDPKSLFSYAIGAARGAVPSDRLLAGRLPFPDRPDEIVVNEPAVAAWHTGVGQRLRIHTLADDQMLTFIGFESEEPRGPVIDATVVGISRGIEDISDLPEPIFSAGPSFLERWGGQIAQATGIALVNVDRHQTDEVIRELNQRMDPHYVAGRTTDQDDFAARVHDTIDVEVTVLTIFAVAAALAGLIIVSQALARTLSGHGPEQESLSALGMTRIQASLATVGMLIPALLVGVTGSIALAIALSPLFPRGLAQRAEAQGGIRIDGPVVLVGGIGLLVVLVAVAGITSWRAVREDAEHSARVGSSRPRLVARLTSALPPVPSLGAMFALEAGSRRRAIGGLAGIMGAAVLVGGVVGVATVERSRHELLTTSALYGAGWDYQLDLEDVDTAKLLPAFVRDPDVTAVGIQSQLKADGGDLDVRGPKGSATAGPVAYTSLKGSIPPVVSHGRPPGPGEAVIGRQLGRRLGAGIGDTVVVHGYDGDVSLIVTGWFVNPGHDDLDLGVLVARDTLDAFTKQGCTSSSEDFACQVEEQGAAVVLSPDAPQAEVVRRLTAVAPELVPVSPPSIVENLREVGATPWLLAGFLALIGGAGLAHALIVGVRRRRHDLAVVRALGLRPSEARRIVTWQAFVMAAVGAAVGLLIGLLVGRLVWERIASGIGAIVQVELPVVALLLAPAVAVVLGLGLSLLTGRRASGLRPAIVLRAE
jgi:hypothetical protein